MRNTEVEEKSGPFTKTSLTQHSIFFGAIPITKSYALNEICPKEASKVLHYVSGVQVLMRIVTLGIYTPWTAEFECRVPEKVS